MTSLSSSTTTPLPFTTFLCNTTTSTANGGSGTSDSPLSTTSSIISILTFALGLLASYIAIQSATRGAPSEIARLVDDLRSTQREINRVAEYIFDDRLRGVVGLHAGGRGGGGGVGVRFVGGVTPGKRPAYDRDDDDDDDDEGVNVNMNGNGTVAGDYTNNPRGGGRGGGGGGGDLYVETQKLLGNCVRLFYEADSLLKRSREDAQRWDLEGLRRRVVFVMNRHEVAEKMQRLGDQKAKLAAMQMTLFMRKSAMQDRVLEDVLALVRRLQEQEGKRGGKSDDEGVMVSEEEEGSAD